MFPTMEKLQIRETKVLLLYFFATFGTVLIFMEIVTVCYDWNFYLIKRGDIRLCYRIKKQIQPSQLTELFPQNHCNFEE